MARVIKVGERRTSMRLEPLFWTSLEEIAHREGRPLPELLDAIDRRKAAGASLTAAVRGYVVAYYRSIALGQ